MAMLHANTLSPDLFWKKRWTKQRDYFELCQKSLTPPKEDQTEVQTGSRYPNELHGNAYLCTLWNNQQHWGTSTTEKHWKCFSFQTNYGWLYGFLRVFSTREMFQTKYNWVKIKYMGAIQNRHNNFFADVKMLFFNIRQHLPRADAN